MIALRLWGDAGIAIATALLTVVILIFGEVTPKTLAALYPKGRLSFILILVPLLKLIYPLVWLVNLVCNAIPQTHRHFGKIRQRSSLKRRTKNAGTRIRHHDSQTPQANALISAGPGEKLLSRTL